MLSRVNLMEARHRWRQTNIQRVTQTRKAWYVDFEALFDFVEGGIILNNPPNSNTK